MTEKQENILNAALELFAEQGYAATSTSKVAKEAGVSEGLIFRHFSNKEGLLNAIMEHIKEMAFKAYAPILAKSDPKEIIKGVLEMPFTISEEQYHFWKLLYSFKWQTEIYDDSISAPIKNALINAFKKLGYNNPEAEAEGIMIIIDGLAVAVLLRQPNNMDEIRTSFLNKYEL